MNSVLGGPTSDANTSGLCPGYRYVENFETIENGLEFEDEEEVFYVTLDLGDVHPTLLPTCSGYRIAVSFFLINYASMNRY